MAYKPFSTRTAHIPSRPVGAKYHLNERALMDYW